MFEFPLVLLVLLALVFTLFALLGWVVARSPLRRRTMDRFARRQHVEIVDANAAHVVSAMLITHRWRRAGLVLGVLGGLVWSLQYGSLTLHFFTGFLGWFVGAVIAEWRISGLDQPGTRRVATLQPRSLSRYVTPVVLIAAALVVVVLVLTGIVAAVRAGVTWSWGGWMAYAFAVTAVLTLTARAIVARPSGFADAAVREADDALRCHGLTVLVGSGIAAAYPPIAGLALHASHPKGVPTSTDPAWTLLVMAALILAGWWVAAWSPSARARRELASAPSAPHPLEQVEEEASTP
ncbi:hypothetical protein GA707_07450 [Nostocoides sp. F2B08]|uniref:hypothetical protein n=1 Tax=Nostocoides sp. F2B08 TaxID=2653936 RepID=UPI001262CAB4|nr:hypothetical protein [Tetrasphaera sp. F2B08]KAB7744454.1 hypothetical protein GA707_07450 [Tetrasphaera sp. F2B08]